MSDKVSKRKKNVAEKTMVFDPRVENQRLINLACETIREAKDFDGLRDALSFLAVAVSGMNWGGK